MLNMQFDERVVVDTNNIDWQPSPVKGVFRKPLAREEAERGHATSIVKYGPNTQFTPHEHPLGEEIWFSMAFLPTNMVNTPREHIFGTRQEAVIHLSVRKGAPCWLNCTSSQHMTITRSLSTPIRKTVGLMVRENYVSFHSTSSTVNR